jgi:hypothetical protein
MDRALKILAALFATAAVVLLACIVTAVCQYIVPHFDNLQSHPKDAALLGLAFGYLVMFVLTYALAAKLIWTKKQWKMALLLAAISCFGIPVGPVLGIAALILLTRPPVRAQFGKCRAFPLAGGPRNDRLPGHVRADWNDHLSLQRHRGQHASLGAASRGHAVGPAAPRRDHARGDGEECRARVQNDR